MNIKNILSISEARKKIFKIAEDVQKPSTYYTLTEHGKPKMVLMSAEEFESLMEDLEILNNPKILADIKKAEDEFARGEYITLQELEKELGYSRSKSPEMVVREKPKRKYNSAK